MERTGAAWRSLPTVGVLEAILVTVTHMFLSVPLQYCTVASSTAAPDWVMLLNERALLEFKLPNWEEVQLKFHVLMSLLTVKLS